MSDVTLLIAHHRSTASTRRAMIRIARRWLGTPYLYGGKSNKGIDCSHFVYQVLNEAIRVAKSPGQIPQPVEYRNTATMLSSGKFFPVSNPEPGDLLFWVAGHVGIVLNPAIGSFIGAQTSTGVAECSYASGYWATHSDKLFLRFVHFF